MSFSPVSLPTPVSIPNGGTGSATGDLSAVNALTAPLLTASTRVDSPSIGTSSSTQHSLPSGTATLLAADSALPAANLTGDVALARIATSLAAGGNTIKGTVVTATTRTETPTIGTDSTNQHALGTGTGALLDANSSLPAANLTGNVAVARIATALAAGGNPITGTVQTATTRTETPTVGTSSSTQHALPAGTADILTADSTATITGKSIDAGQLTGNVLVARIVTALAAGGNPITGTVLTATTRVETPTIGTASGAQHALPSGTGTLLDANSSLDPTKVSTYTASSTFSAANQVTLTGNNGFCVAVQGKYAYVSDLSGAVLSIVDVANPAAPAAIGAVTLAGQLRGLAVQGNYAYVCNNSGNLFYVVDVSNPAAPTSVGSVAITSPYGMCVSGKYAYVFSENGTSSTLKVVDLSTPTAPVVVGSAAIDNVTCTKMDIKGKYLYLCSSTAQTISIYDISTPTAPTRLNTPLNVAIAVIGVEASGRYLYGTDTTSKLVVVDVSNPTTPALITTLTLAGANGGIYLSGRYCFITNSSNSVVRIVDVQTPASPAQVITFATGASTSGLGICVAGKYAYIAYASNPDKLGIVDLGGIETSVIKSASMQTGRALITESLNVAGSLTVNSGLSVGPSGVYCDGLMTAKALNLGDGAVTQATSVSTGVTLNASSGVITTFSQSAAAGAVSTFTVTNSFCLSTSVVLVSVGNYAGTYGTNGFPLATISAVANGSFNVTIINAAPLNALSGALKLNFAIL